MFDTSLSALTAAGGNSRAARSMRARLQWRDRFGRWIEMGRGVKFKVRGADGAARSVIGSFVGAKDDRTGQVYVSRDPNGLPDGFYDVDSANAQEFVANLDESQLAERGIQIGKNADGQAVGERMAENIPNLNQMTVKPAPEGWLAQKGTFGGKKVIETDDGDFRVHFGGKDETVLLEDHRANPGQAQPQRSVAEAFKKVGDVDIQREEGGDTAYTGLAEGNDEKLASLDRDAKIEQIKFNERTINNEKAGLTAKQQATTNNETLKKELADAGTPYDPENGDTDEALAARKAAPATDTANTPTATTGNIDLSTFEVAPEGFLVPTGKKSNDTSPEGLASFMTAEKEQLSKGGARLVVDTDNNTAEIYNSADTLDDAKAQAGGLGQDTVIDLATGEPVKLSEGAVDPNSPDVNPNLDGDTSADAPSGGAPNAEDRNSDAVEPERSNPGTDDAASPESAPEADRTVAPATDGGDTQPVSDTPDGSAAPADSAGDRPSPSSAPGSVEELKDRRAKVQAALDNAGDPKDIIALNEQADALDTRISALEGADVDIQARVREDGGLSVSLDGLEPTDGFMVAVQGHNREIPEDEFFDSKAGPLALKNWIDQNLSALEKPGAHIGIWHDTENREVVLDISERVETREEAERLGIERNQQAIWDVAGGKEIDTGGTGDRAEEEEVRPDSGELPGDERGGEARVREGDPSQDRAADDTDGRVEDRLTEIAANIAELQREFEAAEGRYNASTSEEGDKTAQTDIDRLFDEVAALEDEFDALNARQNAPAEDAPTPAAPSVREPVEPYTDETAAQRVNRELDENEQKQRDLAFYEAEILSERAGKNDPDPMDEFEDYVPAKPIGDYFRVSKAMDEDEEKMRLRIKREQDITRKENAKLQVELERINGVQALDFDADRSTPEAAPAPTEIEAPEAPAATEWSDDRIGEWRDKLGDPGAPEGIAGQAWATQELMGMGAAPEQLSDADFDAFEGEELFRGVSSEENKEQFVSGPNWTGTGGNGSGLYMSTDRGHAGRYGNFEDARIIDAKLKPDANIVDAADLEARRQADFDRHMENDNRLAAQLASGDLNLYASSIGVDGYRVELEGVPSVVLANRNAVVVRSSDVQAPVADAPERPAYQEPGNADAVSTARQKISELDSAIENEEATAATFENQGDYQRQAESLARIRTLERDRRVQENALNRALGNAPMDLNGELGWNMNKPENRGTLPEAPEAPENAPELPGLPEESTNAPEAPEGDTPAILDDSIEVPEAEEVDFNELLRKKLTGEALTPAEQQEFEAMEAANAADKMRPVEERVAEAQAAYDAAEKNLRDMLLADEFDDEEVDKAETLMDWAKVDLDEVLLEQSYEEADRTEREELAADEAEFGPETPAQIAERVLADVADNLEILDGISLADGKGGAFEQKDDPDRVSSGHNNGIEAAKAKMQGKDFTPEEQQAISEALNSEALSDNQLAELNRVIDAAPNKANTTTVARPATEQPEFMSTADVDIVNAEREDPDFVFDEDLTWRKVREEFPNAIELPNGDLILETTTKTTGKSGTKKYDLVMRRTSKNRFMTYILETDEGGNRRAKRVGGSEWHSYEALEKKSIQRGRKLINGARPSSYFANSKENPTENLGTQGFPEDDFLGDIGNPNAPIPATGDERYDHLLEIVAGHIRAGDADIDDIEAHLQRIDPGSGAISTIMNAVIGRAQDNYRPDGVAPWQSYDGETVEIGAEYDWTDWHQEKDWWLPDGTLNPNRKPNRNYGKVERVRVAGYVKENTDGKGHTYGDHVWVQIQKPDGSWSNWTKRSAQTLRLAEPGSDTGLPFFSKREEWRADPEALARRFRVPNAKADEPVVTKERPRRDLPASRRLRFTPRGSLSGYSNVPVPKDQPTIAGMIQREEIRPQIRPARDARPGMMIVRMDDDGNQHVDSIIRVENLGDGGYRIHAARPDGRGYADVDSFVVPENADIPLWTAPGIAAPETPEPKNARRGETVDFDRNGQVETGVIAFDDDNGNLTVVAPGNETIDILESNVRPASYQDITREERVDVLESLDSVDMPQYIRDLVMRGILDPGLSRLRYDQIMDTLSAFQAKTPKNIELDEILDMLGVSDQDRADVRSYLDTDPIKETTND